MIDGKKVNELFCRDQVKLLYNYYREFGSNIIDGNLFFYYDTLRRANDRLNLNNYNEYSKVNSFLFTMDASNIVIALELLNNEVNRRQYY